MFEPVGYIHSVTRPGLNFVPLFVYTEFNTCIYPPWTFIHGSPKVLFYFFWYKINITFVNQLLCVKIYSNCETWWPSHQPPWITDLSHVVCRVRREYLVSWRYGALCSGSYASPHKIFYDTITLLLFAFLSNKTKFARMKHLITKTFI